jgi:hypothetical protein
MTLDLEAQVALIREWNAAVIAEAGESRTPEDEHCLRDGAAQGTPQEPGRGRVYRQLRRSTSVSRIPRRSPSSSSRVVTKYSMVRMTATRSGMSKMALIVCCPCASGAASPRVSSRLLAWFIGEWLAAVDSSILLAPSA